MNEQNIIYAGFWRRFFAMLIDSFILFIIQAFFIIPIWIILGLGAFVLEGIGYDSGYSHVAQFEDENTMGAFFIMLLIVASLAVFLVVFNWLYYAIMESSRRQATIGKMVLGLKVTDLNYNRISFGKATGRYFGKILSGMILWIGYIMAGFTEKKQALHDIIAGCLVIKE